MSERIRKRGERSRRGGEVKMEEVREKTYRGGACKAKQKTKNIRRGKRRERFEDDRGREK